MLSCPNVSCLERLEQVLGAGLRIWRTLCLGSDPHLYHLTTCLIIPQFEPSTHSSALVSTGHYFFLVLHALSLDGDFSQTWAVPIPEGSTRDYGILVFSGLSSGAGSVFRPFAPILDLTRLWVQWVIIRCFHCLDVGELSRTPCGLDAHPEPLSRPRNPALKLLLCHFLEMGTWEGTELSEHQFTCLSNGHGCGPS